MLRVYIAGPISGDSVIDILDNLRTGMQVSYDVVKAGFAPVTPFHNFLFSLTGPMTLKEYYDYTLALVCVCNAVLLVDGWQTSSGALREVEKAKKQGIPVFESLEALQKWSSRQKENR
jgi:hypothetical protein